jgi:hypothetical protein
VYDVYVKTASYVLYKYQVTLIVLDSFLISNKILKTMKF